MADKKISQLPNLTGASLAEDDEFVIVDTSADETKSITWSELKEGLDADTGFVRITGDTMTGDLTVPNVVVSGNVDGRDVSVDGTKLDGIEAGADVNTVDSVNTQTGSVVLDADDISDTTTTNKFTTAGDISKLSGIEAGATADQTKADIDALNVDADTLDGQHGSYYTGYTDTAVANLVDSAPATLDTLNELAAALGDDPNFATTVAASVATKLPKSGGAMTGAITTNSTFDGRSVATDGTKLDGIEAGADVTDTANVTAAGALMDSEVTNLAQVKAFDSADYATAAQGVLADGAVQPNDSPTFNAVIATSYAGDGSALTGLPAGYTNADVDTHLNTSTAANGEVLSWTGTDYDWIAAGGGGGITYTRYTANVTIAANEGVIADTSGGAFTVTLPATPAVGDTVVITDGDDWGTTNLTVARNGSTIEGEAEDMTMDLGGVAVQFTHDGTTWQVYTQVGALAGLGTTRVNFVATAGQTDFSVTYSAGFIDVYLNGIKLIAGSDFTATNGTTVVLTVGATVGDTVDTVSYSPFSVADTYTVAGADATFLTPTGDGSSLTGIDAFKPVAVTGTTPSLDVGSFNFFDNGTLSGDTTVSFASVPTEARWSYSFEPVLTSVYDIANISYVQNFSIAAQETVPTGIFFKPDGTRVYTIGATGDDVNEYSVNTAWDVSTAVFLQTFSVAAQETAPTDVFFKPDGLKMYVLGRTGDEVNEYNLSTAWDVSTAVYLQLFSVAAQDANPYALFFKPDGLKMYVVGLDGQDINEYDLSTAWNISTAVFLQSFSVATQDISPTGLFFKPDGLKMYVSGQNGRDINEYNLSTAWDVSTASFVQSSVSLLLEVGANYGIFFKPDGTKMYVIGSAGDAIYEYDSTSPSTVTLPAAVVGTPTALAFDTRVTYEFVTLDGGTTVNLIAEEVIPT